MKVMGHEAAFANLSAAAAAVLTADEGRAFRSHVETCSVCSEELAALEDLASGLRALPTPQPSAGLLPRLQRRIELELATRSDERLNLLVAVFLLLFSWTVTVAGFLVFRLLSGGGLSLVGALTGPGLGMSLSYLVVAWGGGAAAVVLLGMYERKRRAV